MINTQYGPNSPYFNTGIVNNLYLDIMVNRPIPKLDQDVYWEITPTYSMRPDTLAFDLYQNPRLWWVFAGRNPDVLKDPFGDFLTGTLIYIPKIETLRKALGI